MALYLQVVIGLIILVAADTGVGVLGALLKGTFSLSKLPSFLETAIPTQQLAAFVTAVVADSLQSTGSGGSTALTSTVVVAGGALAAKLAADIASKLTGLATAKS